MKTKEVSKHFKIKFLSDVNIYSKSWEGTGLIDLKQTDQSASRGKNLVESVTLVT